MRWTDVIIRFNPIIIEWQTPTARFFHIELAPSHILRIKIDGQKGVNNDEKAQA